MGLTIERMKYADEMSLSYSGFNELRECIAKVAGVVQPPTVKQAYQLTKEERHSPFIELLNHYDCEGYLNSGECENLMEDFEKYDSDFEKQFPDKYEDYQRLKELIEDTYNDSGVISFR